MKKILLGGGALFIIAAAGLVALPSLVPSSVYKEKIETQLTQELRRPVRVLGDIKLSVFPVIKANAGRVEIDNPAGFTDKHFAAMDAMSARVKLLPLLSKRVEIASFTLKNPVINLEKTANGAVNWVFGDPKLADDTPQAGPFKRDGRYATLDPAIGKFTLDNGSVSYVDAAENINNTLKQVNIDFTLPNLSATLDIDGSLVYNDMPVDIDLSLSSIRSFLDGKAAPVALSLKTDFVDFTSQGRFLPGQDITFDLDVDGDISDVKEIAALSPADIPYADLAQSIKLSGHYGYDGAVLTVKEADISAKGASFDAGFKGNAILGETPVIDGRIELDASDVQSLAAALNQEVQGLNLVQTAKVSATLTAQDKGFSAQDIKADVSGEGLSATYIGTGVFSDTFSAEGQFTAVVASVPNLTQALDMEIPQATALQSVEAKGALTYKGEALSMRALDVKTSGGAVTGRYQGGVDLIKGAPSADGQFNIDIPSVAQVNAVASLGVEAANGVGNLIASGQIKMAGKSIALTDLTANTAGDFITGEYKGDAVLGDVAQYNGTFTTSLRSLASLSQRIGVDIPFAEAIGTVDFSGQVSGAGEAITLPVLEASLSGGMINGRYTGSAAMNKGVNLNGNLSADIPSLRALASATNGAILPPSTQAGTIYEAFTVSGQVTGTPSNIAFEQADMMLDALKGQGDIFIDMTQAKPALKAVVNLDGLDLRPYMAANSAQNPTGEIQPWSETPLTLDFLRAMNGDFNLNTPNIVTDRLSLGQSNIRAKLRDGVMTADLPQMSLYGGLGRMTAVLDGSRDVTRVALDMGLDKLNSNSFLSAVAGFTNATGETGSQFKIRGQGRSQADIMKSLSGQGDFKLVDGQISGVDLSALLTGLDQALTSRSLPGGIGPSHVTKFNDIIGLFTIENGVAKIGQFSLGGLGVLAEGAGQIDLGRQTIDFSLRPRLTGQNASNLGAFGIPIQIKGRFGNVAVGLDSDMLGKIAAERARAEAASLIQKQVGGNLGSVIGGVLGGTQGSPAPRRGTAQPQQPASTDAVVGDLLGGLSGSKKPQGTDSAGVSGNTTDKDDSKNTDKKKEPKLEDTLLDLFGGKKKN